MTGDSIRNGLVEYAVAQRNGRSFDWWANGATLNRPYPVTGVGQVSVVERNTDDTNNSYGNDIHMVFRVLPLNGVERFFKQVGYTSSYDGETWDGMFLEVKATTKTVTVYE